MRILLIGVTGQVGHELFASLSNLGTVIPTTAPNEKATAITLDLADPWYLASVIDDLRPDVIVNAAAYTAVDRAESDLETAMKINGDALATIGREAKRIGATVVHYSSDYVYSNQGDQLIEEHEKEKPINAYGITKLAGDHALATSGADYMIFRTSWVYGVTGSNFVKTMLRLGMEKETLSVVSDQFGVPTCARTLADITAMALTARRPNGIYHVVNSGEAVSWYEFAKTIFELAYQWGYQGKLKKVLPISSEDYKTMALRPKNSRLSCQKLHDVLGIKPAHWQTMLEWSMPLLLKTL